MSYNERVAKANGNRASFSRELIGLQIAWDSVSLGALKKCPRFYQYRIIEGWETKGPFVNLHLRFGQLYHRALEVYDHKKCEGLGHDDAIKAALRDLAEGCMDDIWDEPLAEHREEPGLFWVGFSADDMRPHYKKWWNPEEGLTEKQRETNTKTLFTLFRTVVDYLDRFKDDPIQTLVLANGKPAVELSFRYQPGYEFGTGEELTLCGHMDRVGTMQERNWVVDRKTTKTTINNYFFEKFSPDNQMSGYSLAGKITLQVPIAGVIIDGVQIAKGFSRFERGITQRTDTQLTEWLNDTQYYVSMAEKYAREQYWPMNDTACDNFGGCMYRGICSKSPEVREAFLQGNFIKRQWDPLVVRGDI